MTMTFEDLQFDSNFDYPKGIQAHATFDNEYGASVVKNEISYGHEKGLYELAVLHHGHLCYSTHITDDVLGHLTPGAITKLLKQIEELPKNTS